VLSTGTSSSDIMFKTANAEWCKPVLVLDPAEFPLDAREG
jgi:hypothetical protein